MASNERRRLVGAYFADGNSKTAEVDIGAGYRVAAVAVPDGLNALSAKLVFEVATASGGAFLPLWKTGGSARHEEPLNGATGLSFAVDGGAPLMKGQRFFKLQTLTAADAAQVQASGDTIVLICLPDDEQRVKTQ
jgi:hypothetical protein